MPLGQGLNSRTEIEKLDRMAPEEAAAVPVDQRLELASEALNSRCEALNSRTASLEVKNLEMAPDAAVVVVETRFMGPENSRTVAAAEADENPDQIADEAVAPPCLLELPRLETSAKVQEYLANCLIKLARSSCASDNRKRKATSPAVNDDKQTQFQKSQKESYNCTVCNKPFSSYQALGGHKSIHLHESANNDSPSTSVPPGDVSTLNHSKKTHTCSKCHKSFNTGQALGGHKRLHYERQTTDFPSGGGNGHITHDLNLNPPSPDLELRLWFTADLEVKSANRETESPRPLQKPAFAI